MRAGTKASSTYLIVAGLGGIILSAWAIPELPWNEMHPLRIAAYLVALTLYLWGCCRLASGMGYSWGLGLLGLLCPVGLAILLWLPDRFPEKDEWWKDE